MERHLLPLLALAAACSRGFGGSSATGGASGTIGGPPPQDAAATPVGEVSPHPADAAAEAPGLRPEVGGSGVDGSSDVVPFVRADFGVTTDPSRPPPPVSGGTLAVLAGSKLAVASDPDRDHVYVVDLIAWQVAFDVALAPHDEPGRVVEGPNGTVYVALRRGGAVATIDTSTGAIAERRTVCAAPRGLAYDAASALLHVACAGGELVSLPASGGPEARRLTLDPDLRDVVVDGTTLYVSRFRRAEVLTVDASGVVTERRRPPMTVFPVEPEVAWRMRSLGGGSIMLVHEGGRTGAIPVDAKPDQITVPVGAYSSRSLCGAVVTTVVTTLGPGGAVSSYFVDGTVLPVDFAIQPSTGVPVVLHAAAANTPSTVMPVAVVNTGSFNAGACQQPQALLTAERGIARPPGQLVAIDASDAGSLFVQTREPATLWSEHGRVLTLSTEHHADVGHAIFHADASGVACASCHPEGGEDGRVWSFTSLGARRTPSLRGGIGGTEPFHWDGALTSLSSLMGEVFVRRMAGPALASDQTDALYRWLNSIPSLPASKGDVTSVARGRAIFEDPQVGCASCHMGALLTNNATVDVGTGGPFQVPSLRGVAWRAPYLHDGCAPTLLDRFSACGGGEKHGHTAALSAAQLGDLVTYLQSL